MKSLPVLTLCCLFASCAADSGDAEKNAAAESSAHRPMSQRLNEKNGYAQDSAGNWVPQTDKRSSFEEKGESPYFKGNVAKKEYKAGDYAKKSWWGDTRYEKKGYEGNTSGKQFEVKNRNERKSAREANGQAQLTREFNTSDYATGEASEGGKRITKQSDAETDQRRKVFAEPDVVDWRAQREMSMEESRSILGR